MNKKNNARFRQTEIRMESEALKLMKTLDIKKLTVRKICEKAGVNRSTFYAHFLDIEDMLDKMEMELRKDLMKRYQEKSEREIFSKTSFLRFLEHIEQHQYFYRINLATRKQFPLCQGYDNLYPIIEKRCHQAGIEDEQEILYYLISFQAGFTMVLKQWVDLGCQMEKEKVASIIYNCIPDVWKKEK